jgi:hypothetical protein
MPAMAAPSMPEPSERVLARMTEIGEDLAGQGVTPGKMFGVPSLKAGSKVLCSAWGDDFVVKLPPKDLAATLELKDVALFEPMAGRAMKEWAQVPFAHAKRWPGLVEASLGYVGEG